MITSKSICRFAGATSGGTTIGYGLITALIAVSALGATQLVGERLGSVYGNIRTAISGDTLNPPTPPTLSIADSSGTEGSSITFTVSLSAPAEQDVSFDYVTSDGTATSPSDYYADSGTLTITAGETSTTFNVFGAGDSVYEFDEQMTVTISNPTGASISDGVATGTIIEDDPMPIVSFQGVHPDDTVEEGELLYFNLVLDRPSAFDVTVVLNTYPYDNAFTVVNQATAYEDYGPYSFYFAVIPAGQTESELWITTYEDTNVEAREGFRVQIEMTDGADTTSPNHYIGTITDDD